MLIISSCSTDSPVGEVSIEDEIMPYFIDFQEEGNKRGLDIDIMNAGIDGVFDSINGVAAGQCATYTDGSSTIRVDKAYWDQVHHLKKELLIFHELGHCYLKRNHTDEETDNGRCISLMNSGLGECIIDYNGATRDQFLDELFSN